MVNPTFIIGPALVTALRSSLALIKAMLDGHDAGAAPSALGVADVRDVADLHIRAMAAPEAAGKRLPAWPTGRRSAGWRWLEIIRDQLGPAGQTLPSEEAPGEDAAQLIIHDDRARRELGWRPRPAETTIVETAESLSRPRPAGGTTMTSLDHAGL